MDKPSVKPDAKPETKPETKSDAKPETKSDKLISVRHAADRLACSEASVWRWIQQGRLYKVKVGRSTRLREQDIDAVIRLGLLPAEPAEGRGVAGREAGGMRKDR